jgi:uncharacterized membrane protein
MFAFIGSLVGRLAGYGLTALALVAVALSILVLSAINVVSRARHSRKTKTDQNTEFSTQV